MSENRIDSKTSLRELLSRHDRRVRDAISDVTAAPTGTGRVRALHSLSRTMAEHDSVVASTLCPLLQDLPGGSEVAGRLRQGCEERESLLARFYSLSQGTEAHHVYPTFGDEIEIIRAGLERSFDQHVHFETTRVGELLQSAAGNVDPAVIAARMAIEAGRAPGRPHRMIYRHPTSKTLRALYRGIDRVHDWNDSHHGWPATWRRAARPVRPRRDFARGAPSVRHLLAGYDQTAEAAISELAAAGDGLKWAAAAYQLAAAVAVHDSVLAGTLCRLLDAVPEGRPAAARLRRGCEERAALLEEWDALVGRASPSELSGPRSADAERIIDHLAVSFRAHEAGETEDVSAVVEQMRRRSWTSSGTGLISPYLLPDWPNPEPAVLAAHMALWAEKAPTHPHPLLSRHPANRLLRNLYRHADQARDWRQARRGWPELS